MGSSGFRSGSSRSRGAAGWASLWRRDWRWNGGLTGTCSPGFPGCFSGRREICSWSVGGMWVWKSWWSRILLVVDRGVFVRRDLEIRCCLLKVLIKVL